MNQKSRVSADCGQSACCSIQLQNPPINPNNQFLVICNVTDELIRQNFQLKMASSTLQKLLRNRTQSAPKFFTHFRQPLPPMPPFALTQIPQISEPVDAIPDHPEMDYMKPIHSFCAHVYPSFSFGFFLNPISPTSLIRPEPDGEAPPDDSNVIRADSVKKKRKKKMNKHKLRKLRKRLRRKT